MIPVLDTLAYARQLKASGFTDAQAEGLAEALAAAVSDRLSIEEDVRVLKEDVAVLKVDVRILREEVKAEMRVLDSKIDRVEHRLSAAVANLETRLTIRMGAMAAGTVALVTAIDRLF